MEKREMLECLINYYSDGNKSRFASMLKIRPQTINSWMIRNTMDIELVYKCCDGVSPDWLLSGEGEMLRSLHSDMPTINKTNKELLELCKLLIANFQQRDELTAKLVSMVEHID